MSDHDTIIRQRLVELREEDASGAPSFRRVLLKESAPGKAPLVPRLIGAGAFAAALALAVSLWPEADPDLPEVSQSAVEDLEAAEWPAPSDALLAGTRAAETSDLFREINRLLNQP